MGTDLPNDAPQWTERGPSRGERLFEFSRPLDGARFFCELIDRGAVGCEVYVYRNAEFVLSRMFTRKGSSNDVRERALEWATEYRRLIQGEAQ